MRQTVLILTMVAAMVLAANVTAFASVGQVFIRPQRADGIAYVAGGVGMGERAVMATMEKNYNLRLIFATRKGAYLANVYTTIANADGKVLLNTDSDGPWLFAKLPQGHYKITVAVEKEKIVRDITVQAKPQLIMFHWAGIK